MVLPVIDPEAALMVAEPATKPSARPLGEMVVIVVFDVDHFTELVRFCVLLSVNVPVAVNCWVSPRAAEGFAGVTAMDTKAAAETVDVVEPVTEPEAA